MIRDQRVLAAHSRRREAKVGVVRASEAEVRLQLPLAAVEFLAEGFRRIWNGACLNEDREDWQL